MTLQQKEAPEFLTGTTGEREPEIHAEMVQLQKSIEFFAVSLDEVRSRLHTVLRPDEPTPSDEQTMVEKVPACPLSGDLRDAHRRITALTNQLRGLTSRLEV